VKGKRIIKSTLKIIVAAGFILVTAFIILNSLIQKKIRQQLTNLSPALQVKFASIHTNFFSSSVSFDSLEINFIPYNSLQQNRHSLYFPHASLRQISFLKFLFNKKLVAENFLLEEGNIQLDQFLLEKRDSLQSIVLKRIEWPFKKLFIRNVELKRVKAFLHSDKKDQLLTTGDIMIGGISVNKPGDSPIFTSIDLRLSDIDYPLSGYRFHIRQLAINSNRKIVEVDSLRFFSNRQYNETKISSIEITGFDVTELINKQVVNAEKIIIGESKIVVNDNEKLKTQSLPFDLKKLYVNNFQCRSASILYKDKKNKCSFIASINLHKLNIDKSFDTDGFHFASMQANLSEVLYSGSGYHSTEIKNIELDSKKEIIQVEALRIIPQFGKYEFGRKLGRQADWMKANVSKIEIIKPDIHQLFHQKLVAEKVHIGESRAYIFRDRRLPRPQKIIPLPVAYMRTLPFDIRVKTVELANSSVAYEEYPKAGYGQTGILRIEKVKASLSPLINHPVASDPAYITMKVVGSIMGSGTAHGTIIMPLQKNIPYRIKGAIERLELTKLNSSSENLGKIRIKSGFLDFLFFDFTMTEQRSTGKIIGAYHRLVIQQLKKHTEERNVADFASFMLRHLIIPLNKDKSLPERKRTGLVDYQRDPTRFVSHYFLQSLLMGVKKSFTLGFLLPK
jgi:hypothetical protein